MSAKANAENERLARALIERPHVLLLALVRDPDLLNRALFAAPALRKEVLSRTKAPAATRGRPHSHDEVVRAVIGELNQQLRASGWKKNDARYEEIARIIGASNARALWGKISARQVRHIVDPR